MRALENLSRLVRRNCLASTTKAGSGHPTTALSATDLMVNLMFGGHFKADLDNPAHPNNDRLVFSKGHAAPLLYALYHAAGKLTDDELMSLREFGSPLEGHPTLAFPYTEAPTGSLGQGLSIGFGIALNAKIDQLPYRSFVLMGDSETAEGAVWEAMALASHYKLDNLTAVLDVNRFGQRGPTMLEHDLETYRQRAEAFGWRTFLLDGHCHEEINAAYQAALEVEGGPSMLIAKTFKGKGASLVENEDNWHGKPLSQEQCEQAIQELGEIDDAARGSVPLPADLDAPKNAPKPVETVQYQLGDRAATRQAYGNALARIYPDHPNIVALDAETSNSTYAQTFQKGYPDRFFEMYIAEQNMVGAAIGLSRRGKTPFVSTFAAFFSRAFDQIRMSQYSGCNIKYVGSHAGVSIGEDGASQMGLEDIAMFRTLLDSVVLYPSDPVQTDQLVELAARHEGNVYMRTTRMSTPVLYDPSETFRIGGSKTLRESDEDAAALVGAGVTLHEALKAADALAEEGVRVRVIDLYSVKPLDRETLLKAARETKAVIVAEDHFAEGGIGEAVRSALGEELGADSCRVISLAVRKMPQSGPPDELLDYEGISAGAIAATVKEILG